MARYDMLEIEGGASATTEFSADVLFDLGLMYSAGGSVPADLVSAHKWFNIAAARGHGDAIRLRREIAADMSEAEVAAAQRAARDWLTRH